MIFTKNEFDELRRIVFATDSDGRALYPGYRPHIVESPNGDGKLDATKRYAHVALKYLRAATDARGGWDRDLRNLDAAIGRCHAEALRVHRDLGLPAAWAPTLETSALRILEYPPGATSALHTDFDMFTLLAYRDPFGGLVRYDHSVEFALRDADQFSIGMHFGELYELGGFGRATSHEVEATSGWQYSAVYFALPRHDLVLPDGRKVGPDSEPGTYLHERMSRSRLER